jgi:hypothetical protein
MKDNLKHLVIPPIPQGQIAPFAAFDVTDLPDQGRSHGFFQLQYGFESMTFMLMFMGFLAFLSGYFVSLEDRFQRDGLFCPFSLAENLKASPGARKVLTWFGIALWGLAVVCYIFLPLDVSVLPRDTLKGLSAGLLVYGFMFLGYAREIEFGKTGQSVNAIPSLDAMSRYEKRVIATRASMALGKILFFFMALGAFRWIFSGVV